MVWFQLVWKLLVIFDRTTASSAGFSLHDYHVLFWSFWPRQLPTGVCVCVCVFFVKPLFDLKLLETDKYKQVYIKINTSTTEKKQPEVVDFFEAGPKFPGKEQMLTFIEDTFFWMWNEQARAMAMFFEMNVWKGMVQLSPINGRLWTCVCVCLVLFLFLLRVLILGMMKKNAANLGYILEPWWIYIYNTNVGSYFLEPPKSSISLLSYS